ncbi:MAG TPA: hypothetical protein VK867_00060 [Candidatus Limnocylindrales bacterium]|nr:hypothetical protein [Candidatus Limnocylindrales bacterium]
MSVVPPFADRRRALPDGAPARRAIETIFPDARPTYVERWDAIADLFDTFDDQRPATCGAYATRYLLAPLGFPQAEGVDTTREDYLAHLAGTVIEETELEDVRATAAAVETAGLSDAEAIDRFPRTWYGWQLRSSNDDAITGTSPTGVARAIALGSGGALVTLPVPSRRSDRGVAFTPARFDALLDVLGSNVIAWGVHPIANLEVDQLLDATSDAFDAPALAGPDPEAAIPRERWGVGHFVGVGAFWRDPAGRRWTLLLDTYKARGFDGYVPMPAESLRRALVREDGRDGGLLLVVRRPALDDARRAIEALDLDVRMWGNGSLEPDGWDWAIGR